MDFLGSVVSNLLGGLGSVVGAILGNLVRVFTDAATWIVSFLPDATNLGLSIPHGLIALWTFADAFLPLHEAASWFLFFVGLQVATITWKGLVMIYHLIPKPLMGT